MPIYEIVDNQIIYTISKEDDGISLRQVLRHLRISRTALHRYKEAMAIKVAGLHRRANEQVFAGEVLTICLDDPTPSMIIAENGKLDILMEDDAIIAVNKPAGMPTHPSRLHLTGTLANYLSGYLQTGSSIQLINRLDKDTSGIVLAAKKWVL